MVDGFGANIEKVRRDGTGTVVVFPNIGAVRNHPFPHILGFFVVRTLASSTANILSRDKQDMLGVRKKGFKIGLRGRQNKRSRNLSPAGQALEDRNNAPLDPPSQAPIMKHVSGSIKVNFVV